MRSVRHEAGLENIIRAICTATGKTLSQTDNGMVIYMYAIYFYSFSCYHQRDIHDMYALSNKGNGTIKNQSNVLI